MKAFDKRELAIKDLMIKLEFDFNFGVEYFEGEIEGESFKVRMNKDHARNRRNDDNSIHNLSMVNISENTCIGWKKEGRYIQSQVDRVFSWEKAKMELEEFFHDILSELEDFN